MQDFECFDEDQLRRVKEFDQAGFLETDLHLLSPEEKKAATFSAKISRKIGAIVPAWFSDFLFIFIGNTVIDDKFILTLLAIAIYVILLFAGEAIALKRSKEIQKLKYGSKRVALRAQIHRSKNGYYYQYYIAEKMPDGHILYYSSVIHTARKEKSAPKGYTDMVGLGYIVRESELLGTPSYEAGLGICDVSLITESFIEGSRIVLSNVEKQIQYENLLDDIRVPKKIMLAVTTLAFTIILFLPMQLGKFIDLSALISPNAYLISACHPIRLYEYGMNQDKAEKILETLPLEKDDTAKDELIEQYETFLYTYSDFDLDITNATRLTDYQVEEFKGQNYFCQDSVGMGDISKVYRIETQCHYTFSSGGDSTQEQSFYVAKYNGKWYIYGMKSEL